MVSRKSYFYEVYGLKVKSGIEIPEFVSIDEENMVNIDVDIYYSNSPEEMKSLRDLGRKNYISKNEIWFDVKGVASYYIKEGKIITVELYENYDKELLRIYLMCSCLGFIMLQRGKVAIHGGVVSYGNKAFIFTGDRGAGKSTLTTALRKNGYKFLSDDVAAIKFEDELPYVEHGFPYQKLCGDAMESMGYDKELYSSFASEAQRKYLVPVYDEFINDYVQLSAVFKIVVDDVEDVCIKECTGSEKLNEIINNIYRGEFIKELGGVSSDYFKQCIDIAKNIRLFEIVRPRNKFTVDKQIELIESVILEKSLVL